MADIDLVIKISERDYALACNYPDVLIAKYAHYIKDGIPLPKGHGRLIDADYIKLFSIDHDSWNGVEYEGVIKVVPVIAIDNASTIIEADKEAENE